MTKWLTVCGWLLGAATLGAQDVPVRPRPSMEAVAQPATWVAFRSVVERDGVAIGRFWRDARGSTRLELDSPDAHGRTIIIENVPAATYYVFRPASGWTAQPMVLPTGGWTPLPVARMDVGTPVTEAGLPAYERVTGTRRERRAPALNFFPIVRERLDDGSVERHRDILLGDVGASLFRPPFGVNVTERPDPGGIVALPMPRGGGQ
jgi:hypothetical protein